MTTVVLILVCFWCVTS